MGFKSEMSALADTIREILRLSNRMNVDEMIDRISNSDLAVGSKIDQGTVTIGPGDFRAIAGIRIFGNSKQSVENPTPDNPAKWTSIGENGDILLTVNNRRLPIPVSEKLMGVAVTNEEKAPYDCGMYYDKDGVCWICDEIDFRRKIHIKRIEATQLKSTRTSSGKWIASNDGNIDYFYAQHYLPIKALDYVNPFCTHFTTSPKGKLDQDLQIYMYGDIENYKSVKIRYDAMNASLDDFTAWLDNNEVYVIGVREKPIETPLTDEQLGAYAMLYTGATTLTVSNNENAYMSVMHGKAVMETEITPEEINTLVSNIK